MKISKEQLRELVISIECHEDSNKDVYYDTETHRIVVEHEPTFD